MSSKRDPLQVSPKFRVRIIQLQNKLNLKNSKKLSIREVTEMIVNSKAIDDIEKKLLANALKQADLQVKFDRRLR